MPVELGGVVVPDQRLNPLPQVLRPEPEEGGDPLLDDRSDEAQHAVEENEPEGDVNDGVVEHGWILSWAAGVGWGLLNDLRGAGNPIVK